LPAAAGWAGLAWDSILCIADRDDDDDADKRAAEMRRIAENLHRAPLLRDRRWRGDRSRKATRF
jgi:hypothetical protein